MPGEENEPELASEESTMEKLAKIMLQQQQDMADQKETIRLLTKLVENSGKSGSVVVTNGVSLETIEKRLRMFSYDPDEGFTAEKWFSRYESIFSVDLKDTSEEERARVVMRHVDDKAYNRIADDIRPRTVGDLKFDEVVKVMKKLFGEKKSIFEKRLDLFKLSMAKSHCTELREFAGVMNKAFEEAQIKEMTPDQMKAIMFLTAIDLPRFTPTLFHVMNQAKSDTDLSLDTLLEVADRFQTVQHDSLAVANQTQVNLIGREGQRKWRGRKTPGSVETSQCTGCGRKGHSREKCPHSESECYNCGKKGHLANVCKSKTTTQQSRKQRKPAAYRVALEEKGQQADIQVEMDGKVVKMRLDTGSDLTLISERTWSRIGKPPCGPTDAFPLCANSTVLQLKGKCNVSLKVNGITAYGGVYVTNEDVNLLGEDFRELFFDLVPKRKDSTVPHVRAVREQNTEYCKKVQNEYPEICEEGLGRCTKMKAELCLKEGANPVFCHRRDVPIAMLPKVETEIERLEKLGVIEKVDYIEWAAPILVVPKANGGCRVCVDFSTGLNRALESHNHPLPLMSDIFAKLEGCTVFTQIDLADAYLQIEMAEESKRFLGVSTHKGIYRYTRLPFGVSAAPGIFQKCMDTMLSGCENAQAYLDDIIIGGKDKKEHDANLDKVLMRIRDFGFRIKPEKCSFGMHAIRYLGFVLDKNGRRPDPKKIKAVMDMPEPVDQPSLRSFLGMVSYYGQFIDGMHKLRAPLDELLKKDVTWVWTSECARVFKEMKSILSSDLNLIHFDPNEEIVMAADASEKGIGAVLMHKVNGRLRPVAHAARALKPAERRYSKIEKEGLGLVFGVKKFHRYLFGRNFTMQTDHKPLLSIFGSKSGVPVHTAKRLFHWCTILLNYSFRIEYVGTNSFAYADALSRLIAQSRTEETDEDEHMKEIEAEEAVDTVFCNSVRLLPISARQIKESSERDPMLQRVREYHLSRWPDAKVIRKTEDVQLLRFFHRRNELSLVDDCLMVSNRVVIPLELQQRVLKVLHGGHPGIVRMKALARGVCYWTRIDEDIESLVKSCDQCQSAAKMPVKVPLEPWRPATEPWERVHIDYAGPVDGQYLLVIVDSFSKWPEVVITSTMTTSATLRILTESFARNGNPKTLVSDNGPQFVSDAFKQFCESRGIIRMNTPPYHPSSNGQAERYVDTVKRGLQKLKSEKPLHEALQIVLSSYRSTPNRQCGGKTPSEMFMGRRVRTEVDLLRPNVNVLKEGRDETSLMKDQYDRKHGAKPRKFKIGDLVMYGMHVPPNGFKWCKGEVTSKIGKVMYSVKLEQREVRAHANQLRLYGVDTVSEKEFCETDYSMLPFVERVEPVDAEKTSAAVQSQGATPPPSPIQPAVKLNAADVKKNQVTMKPSPSRERPQRIKRPTKKLVMDPTKKSYVFE